MYTAKTHTTGGRDGDPAARMVAWDIKLSVPGAPGHGTNPEQLLAAGWSACFTSAMKIEAGKMKVTLPPGLAVDAEVDLCVADGVTSLRARLNASLPGLEREVALGAGGRADQTCPYSKATRAQHRRRHHVVEGPGVTLSGLPGFVGQAILISTPSILPSCPVVSPRRNNR